MQILLDPFEKEFDLPSTLVDFRDRQRWQSEVVGQEHEPSVVLGVVEHDATQGVRVQPRRLRADQDNRLIASQSRRFVDPPAAPAGVVEAALCSRHEERQARREPMKTSKIDITPVHHVERARFDRQMVEDRHIVRFPIGNPHETGDVASQVHERVQLHGAFAPPKSCPWKQTQAEVDRGAVERIGGLFQLHTEGFLRVELSRLTDQHLSEIREDAPVVNAVGIGQFALRHLAAEARMIELGFAARRHVSMSRRLSRKVVARNVMQKNWSRHEKPRGRRSPPYRLTHASKSCRGTNSIS